MTDLTPPEQTETAFPIENAQDADRTDLTAVAGVVARLKGEMSRVILGQERLLDEMIAALLASGHALIEGVPGVAKTMAARALSKAIGLEFRRIQFTPDLMPSDVLGTMVFNQKSAEFEFHPGPIFGQMILIDEINRAPAKTQSALFEVMEERQVTIDGTTYPMELPFVVFATQNPIEHEGTYRLPEAQLDRFLIKIDVPYPELEAEVAILTGAQQQGGHFKLGGIQNVVSAQELEHAQLLVNQVRVEPDVLRYIAQIVAGTRRHPAILLGASPRASLAVLAISKAFAAMQGRDFATPEDVQEAVLPVLRHRIILTPEREIDGARPGGVLRNLVASIQVPR